MQHAAQGCGDAAHCRDGSPGECLCPLLVRRVHPADERINSLRQHDPLLVEGDHQAAKILVVAFGVDQQQRLAPGGFEAERIRVGSLVAVAQPVVLVGQQRIGSPGDDDVNVYQFGRQRLLDCDLLHVCQ